MSSHQCLVAGRSFSIDSRGAQGGPQAVCLGLHPLCSDTAMSICTLGQAIISMVSALSACYCLMNPVRFDRGSQSEQYMKCVDACKPTHYKGLKCVERLLSKQQQQQIEKTDMFNVGITKTEFR
jgi:hypothetical protein